MLVFADFLYISNIAQYPSAMVGQTYNIPLNHLQKLIEIFGIVHKYETLLERMFSLFMIQLRRLFYNTAYSFMDLHIVVYRSWYFGGILMICRKCKKELQDDAVYCCYCGKKQIAIPRQKNTKSRGNGTGSIYQLPNKKWKASVVDHYYIGKSGKILAKRKTKTCERKNDAINALGELKIAEPKKAVMNLNNLYQAFTSTKKYEKLSKSQQDKMKFAWDRMKVIQLIKITDLTIEIMQDTIDTQKMKDGSPITYYPARDMKVLLSHLFTVAIQRSQETFNRSQYIELPDAPNAKREVFTEEEMAKFWDDYNGQNPGGATEPYEFTGYILIMSYTGMRIGELYKVEKQNIHIDERYMIGGEKSAAGIDREIPLSMSIINVVKHFYEINSRGLVQRNLWGFYEDYWNTLERLGIRELPPQTCRHTYFTMMAQREVHPALIAAMGGHAQYETAIDNYNRLPLNDKISAADKL